MIRPYFYKAVGIFFLLVISESSIHAMDEGIELGCKIRAGHKLTFMAIFDILSLPKVMKSSKHDLRYLYHLDSYNRALATVKKFPEKIIYTQVERDLLILDFYNGARAVDAKAFNELSMQTLKAVNIRLKKSLQEIIEKKPFFPEFMDYNEPKTGFFEYLSNHFFNTAQFNDINQAIYLNSFRYGEEFAPYITALKNQMHENLEMYLKLKEHLILTEKSVHFHDGPYRNSFDSFFSERADAGKYWQDDWLITNRDKYLGEKYQVPSRAPIISRDVPPSAR